MNPEDNSRKDNRAATKVLRNRLAENLQKETLQRAKSRTKVTILDPVNGGISPKTCKLSSHHSLLTRAETIAEKNSLGPRKSCSHSTATNQQEADLL